VNRLLQARRQYQGSHEAEPAAHGRHEVTDIHAIAPVGRPDDILHLNALTVPHLADVARLVYQLDGSRHGYPYGRRSDSGAPTNERQIFGRSGQGGAQTLKAVHLEALLVRKFCDPLERLLAVDGELP
jgi:hypothetical protein